MTTSFQYLRRAIAGLTVAALLLTTNCGSQEFSAVVEGLEAAVGHLNNQNGADDVTFDEWLLNELNDFIDD